MKRINSVTDALNTNKVQVDVGDGIVIPLPTDGVFGGEQGPAGVGIPTGGTSGQVVQKTAAGTIWATPSKDLVGLTKVDNTADAEKPLSEPQALALTNKADLIGGKVAASQLPEITPVTDSTIAPLINGATTGAAIDARINTQVAPQVQQITAAYIAGDRTVADAAAAAVNANPAIAGINGKLSTANYLRGVLPTGTDLNEMTASTDNGTWQLSSSSAYVNSPFAGAGHISVNNTGTGSGSQTAIRYGFNDKYERQIQNYSAKTWRPWERRDNSRIAITSGTDIDTLRENGRYVVTSNAIGATLINAPSSQPAHVDVEAGATGLVTHTWRELYSSGGGTTFYRTTASIGTTPYPFGAWRDFSATSNPALPSSEAALAHTILVQDFTRRYGGRKRTGGKGAVAFRFDHGLNNYASMLLPLMQAHRFKHSQALSSAGWELPENNAVTRGEVNALVASGILEIWNHGGMNHSDADTSAKLVTAIVDGLAILRADLPAAKIDGWAIPGVTGTLYMGFNGGITPDKFYATEAGRAILANHAVSTGGIAGTHQRVLDGTVRQGQHQYTIDDRTVTQIKAEVDSAIARKTGLQLMLHPSVVGTTGRISVADFSAVLDYVKAKEAAGEIVVLSPYELMVADSF